MNTSLAHAQTQDEVFQRLRQSPTGKVIVKRLQVLLNARDPRKKIEIHFFKELTEEETVLCRQNWTYDAFSRDVDPSTGRAVSLIFCRDGDMIYYVNTLAHEGTHAFNRLKNPAVARILSTITQLENQNSPDRFGYLNLLVVAREYQAYAVDYQVTKDVFGDLDELSQKEKKTPLFLNTKDSKDALFMMVDGYLYDGTFQNTLDVVSRLTEDELEDFYTMIPKEKLEMVIDWMRARIALEHQTH